MTNECHKDDPHWRWPCSCNTCARAAAHAWINLMDRVHNDEITLAEAQHLEGRTP